MASLKNEACRSVRVTNSYPYYHCHSQGFERACGNNVVHHLLLQRCSCQASTIISDMTVALMVLTNTRRILNLLLKPRSIRAFRSMFRCTLDL
ncbi:hypothetical protein CY34DRAFT_811762, partial [Suillus luteus UH-Slu-Lm8-n1]